MSATCVSVVRAARYRGLVVPTRRPRVSAPLAPEPEPEPVAGQGVGGVGYLAFLWKRGGLASRVHCVGPSITGPLRVPGPALAGHEF